MTLAEWCAYGRGRIAAYVGLSCKPPLDVMREHLGDPWRAGFHDECANPSVEREVMQVIKGARSG